MTMVQRDVQQLVAKWLLALETPAPADIAKLTPQLFQSFWGADFGIGAGRGAGVRRF